RDLNEQQTEILRLGFPCPGKSRREPSLAQDDNVVRFSFCIFFSLCLCVSVVKSEKQKTGAFSPENLRRLFPQFRGLRPLISLFGLTYEFSPLRPRIHNDVS